MLGRASRNLFHSSVLQQRGASLLEVLVSILIASFGLLALAGVNAASVRYSKFSQYRSVATILAQDITDRMRANRGIPSSIASYAYNTTNFAGQASLGSAPSPACDTAASSCTEAQLAAVDVYQWRQAVRNNLPEGSVFLDPDSVVANAADLWIAWREVKLSDDEYSELSTKDCPNDLAVSSDKSIRCIYFRVQI